MRKKAAIAASAMLLAIQLGRPVDAQELGVDQLSTIASLLDDNDVGGLRTYLEANPELLEGDTQLAVLLRRFLAESQDIVTYLGIEPDLGETVRGLQALRAPLEEGSDPGDDPDEAPDEAPAEEPDLATPPDDGPGTVDPGDGTPDPGDGVPNPGDGGIY